jgi:phage shock protein A
MSTILRANVNDWLGRSRNPEQALDEYLRELADAVRDGQTQVADAFAQVQLTRADLAQSDQLAAEWQRKAEQAVATGADDLARDSLRHKHDFEGNAQVYRQQLATQEDVAAKLQAALQQLEAKYAAAQRDRDALLARYRGAQAAEAIQSSLTGLSLSDPSDALDRMDERIRQAEARAAAANEIRTGLLEGRFASLEGADTDRAIEAELASLKAKNRSQASGNAAQPKNQASS